MIRALLIVAVTVPAVSLAAGEKPNPYLAQAKVFYQGGENKKCLERVAQGQKWESSTPELAELALYAGLCGFNPKKPKNAELDFLRALQTDPTIELPAATSPKIAEVWNRVREKVPRPAPPVAPPLVTQKEPEPVRPPPPAVEPPPPAPPIVVEAPPARGPPVAGLVVSGVAVVAVGVAVTFGLLANSNNTASQRASFQSDAIAFRRMAESQALVANVSYVGAGVAALTGLLLFFLQR